MNWRLFGQRQVELQLQTEAAECGLACIAMLAAYHGRRTDLATLRQRHSISQKGATLVQLLHVAQALELTARPLRLELDDMHRLQLPCILHWAFDHFVVLERLGRRFAIIADPAQGRRRIRLDELGKAFTGVALEMAPTPEFRPAREETRLYLRDIVRGSTGLARALGLVLLLSIGLQALALLLPYYSQLVFDQVVISNDHDLLLLLALAAALLVGLQALLSLLRSWVVIVAGARLNLQWTTRVFRHLLRLPLDFFEKRHLGDVQSRFGSVSALQQLVTGQFVEAFIDGLMTVSTLFMLYRYDASLAGAVLFSVVLYLLVRALLYPAQLRAARAALAAGARRDSCFLESVRGLQAIKSFGGETARELLFQQKLVAAWNDNVRSMRLGAWQAFLRQAVFSLQFVVVLWLGAQAVLATTLTPGMLVALLSYRALFTERAAALVDRAIEFRLARLQLDRLADIVRAPVEPAFAVSAPPARTQPRLSLRARHLSFRYGDFDPPVVHDVSFSVHPGEHVVLTGPSGSGKTTLLKVLMGLLEPTEGEVLVDGMPLARFGVRRFRYYCAGVMQDDFLLSGTLLDNISFFDVQVDRRRVERCAALADIDREIAAMPMQYHTLAGDMGSSLSGGQRQRLLLARALYQRPRVLFLDEFTNQLDSHCEARIHANLARLGMTVIAVAHRPASIARADRQVLLAPKSVQA